MPRVTADRIIWDENDWVAGLSPQHTSNAGLSVGGNGASFMRNVNPFRRLGGIAPGFLPSNVSNYAEVDGIVTGGDADISGTTPYAYLIQGASGSTKVHRLDLSTDNITTTGGFPRTVAHGAHTSIAGQEVLVTSVGASTVAFYSFVDGSDGDIGMYDIAGATFDDDFFSTAPSGATVLTATDPHPMIIGDDGAMYVGNGRTLYKFDGETGANGTITTPFTLPRGFVIRSFKKTLNYLAIFTSRSNGVGSAYYRGTSVVWMWNYVSDRPNFQYPIPDNFLIGAFDWNGRLGCFSFGRSGEARSSSTRVWLFDGNGFQQAAIYPRNPPGNSGVEIHDSMLFWNFGNDSQSFLGAYGSPWPGKFPEGLHYIGEPSGLSQTAGVAGICRNFGGAVIYASSGASDSGGLQIFSTSTYGPSQTDGSFWQGLVAVPFLPRGEVGRLKSVRVTFRNTASGGRDITLQMRTDFRADRTITVMSAVTEITATTMTREFRFDTSGNPTHFTSLAPNIIWSTGSGSADAPTVYRIEAFYDTIKLVPNW